MKFEVLDQGLTRAFRAFMAQYSELGGHRFHGFTDHGDPLNYQGPLLWSEGDCQFRCALALDKEFPGMVHLEVPVAKVTFHDYDPQLDKRQFIDSRSGDETAGGKTVTGHARKGRTGF